MCESKRDCAPPQPASRAAVTASAANERTRRGVCADVSRRSSTPKRIERSIVSRAPPPPPPVEPVIFTVTDWAPLPPGPVHVSVNVVSVDSAEELKLPCTACDPDQPPDAVHEVAFSVVHVRVTVLPEVTFVPLAVSVTVGGGGPTPTVMA